MTFSRRQADCLLLFAGAYVGWGLSHGWRWQAAAVLLSAAAFIAKSPVE